MMVLLRMCSDCLRSSYVMKMSMMPTYRISSPITSVPSSSDTRYEGTPPWCEQKMDSCARLLAVALRPSRNECLWLLVQNQAQYNRKCEEPKIINKKETRK